MVLDKEKETGNDVTADDWNNVINYINSLQLIKQVVEISDDYDAKKFEIVLCDAEDDEVDITLPKPSENIMVDVKKIDDSANDVIIHTDGDETIDGDSTKTISSENDYYNLVSDGDDWYLI